jgi:hypothetical protein
LTAGLRLSPQQSSFIKLNRLDENQQFVDRC